MFTGSSKQRHVGVPGRGGRGGTAGGRDALLARAAAERNARQADRDREKASIKIQSAVRGWKARLHPHGSAARVSAGADAHTHACACEVLMADIAERTAHFVLATTSSSRAAQLSRTLSTAQHVARVLAAHTCTHTHGTAHTRALGAGQTRAAAGTAALIRLLLTCAADAAAPPSTAPADAARASHTHTHTHTHTHPDVVAALRALTAALVACASGSLQSVLGVFARSVAAGVLAASSVHSCVRVCVCVSVHAWNEALARDAVTGPRGAPSRTLEPLLECVTACVATCYVVASMSPPSSGARTHTHTRTLAAFLAMQDAHVALSAAASALTGPSTGLTRETIVTAVLLDVQAATSAAEALPSTQKQPVDASPLLIMVITANVAAFFHDSLRHLPTASSVPALAVQVFVELFSRVPVAAIACPVMQQSRPGDALSDDTGVPDESDVEDSSPAVARADLATAAAAADAAASMITAASPARYTDDSLPSGIEDRANVDVAVATAFAERSALHGIAADSALTVPVLVTGASAARSVSGVADHGSSTHWTSLYPSKPATGPVVDLLRAVAPGEAVHAKRPRLGSAALSEPGARLGTAWQRLHANASTLLGSAWVQSCLPRAWHADVVHVLLESCMGGEAAAVPSASVWQLLRMLEGVFRGLRMRDQLVRRSVSDRSGGTLHVNPWRGAVHYVHRVHASTASLLLGALTWNKRTPAHMLQRLWRMLRNDAGFDALSRGASRSIVERPDIAASVRMFLLALDYMLTTSDDIEVFERLDILPAEQLVEVQAWLRDWTYRLFWSDAEASDTLLSRRPVEVLESMHSAMRVYNMLYDRHCRRPFVADDAWLWPALPASEVNAGVLSGVVDTDADEALAARAMAASAGMQSALAAATTTQDAEPVAVRSDDAPPEVDAAAVAYVRHVRRARQLRAQIVLMAMPQTIPFQTRVGIFVELRDADRESYVRLSPSAMLMRVPSRFAFTVRRTHLVEDSFRAFKELARRGDESLWKLPFSIQFINKEGLEEAGIDGGGLLKEFIDSVVKEAFSGKYALFDETAEHALYPHAAATSIGADALQHFEFLGRLLGKALYDGILVEPRFAHFFLRKLLGRANLIDDLQSLDPTVYRSLMSLKRMSPAELDAVGLTFEVSAQRFGEVVSIPLVAGGRDLPVTAANVLRYVLLVANYQLNAAIAPQCRAFLSGFREIIPLLWMRMFSPTELQLLIGGSDSAVDLGDLRAHCVYHNGYHAEHAYIRMFWNVLASFSDEDMKAFLMFVTSCSRPPLRGFGSLNPLFGIARVPITDDSERLPTSGTCHNLLKLPQYSSEAVLREKLLYAIRSGAGFELS